MREIYSSTPVNGISEKQYDQYGRNNFTYINNFNYDYYQYAFDSLGNRIRTAFNSSPNDFDGNQKLQQTITSYEEDSRGWWRVTTSSVWPEDNNASSLTTSISRVRMTGLGTAAPAYISPDAILISQSEEIDWLDNTTRTSTFLDYDNATTWQVTESPTSIQPVIQKSVAGMPVESISASAITNGVLYDGFARMIASVDGRSITNRTAYNDLGQVAYVEDGAANRTSFVYDIAGRRIASINALGEVSHFVYDSVGQMLATYGTSYPVAYQYDSSGRKIAMATTRDPDLAVTNLLDLVPAGETLASYGQQAGSSVDLTRWIFDNSTGQLSQKIDASGESEHYYYLGPNLDEVQNARGDIEYFNYYSEWKTYHRSMGSYYIDDYYDRMGRVICSYVGHYIEPEKDTSVDYEYTGLHLNEETQNGYVIDRKYDSFGRNTGYDLYLPSDLENPVQELSYGYDDYGRFSMVTSVCHSSYSTVTNIFEYSRLEGTDIVSGYSGVKTDFYNQRVQTERTFELNRNLTTSVTNKTSYMNQPFGVVSAFSHTYDELGRRTTRDDYFKDDYTPASTTANSFAYNIFSEVTNAVMGSSTYNYDFDAIGNLSTSELESDVTSYVANNLNQYTSITDPSSNVSLPVYDNDGNLIDDGTLTYSWNSLNQLIAWSNRNDDVWVVCDYDHMGRRISKKTYFTYYDGTIVLSEHRKFIYDGWNLIYEDVVGSGSDHAYTWGLDLSGTLQGAGGVGGLLVYRHNLAYDYFPLADANGNITEYVYSDYGTIENHIQYDPFGRTIYEDSDESRFRFSSKYYESFGPYCPDYRLYYYGHRWYHAGLDRFLSRDPIEERGGNNLYGFVGNDAVNKIDPKGESAYLVYRPFNSRFLKWLYPLVGHYYLAFDDEFREGERFSEMWRQRVSSAQLHNYPTYGYQRLMTFSFHPLSVRASVLGDVPQDAGVQVSTFVTEGSFVAINDTVDIEGYQNAGKWFGLGRGRTHKLTDQYCKQVALFYTAVHSANLNNSITPDPGNYQVLNQNCGTWAKLMISRANLSFPFSESAAGNLGGGIGGLSDLTKLGDVTTYTFRSLYEMAQKFDSMSSNTP